MDKDQFERVLLEELARIYHRLGGIERRVDQIMDIDQAAFDVALTAFLAELDQVLAGISTKAPGADFSAEKAQLDAAKVRFDAALAGEAVPAGTQEPPLVDTSQPNDPLIPDASGDVGDAGSGVGGEPEPAPIESAPGWDGAENRVAVGPRRVSPGLAPDGVEKRVGAADRRVSQEAAPSAFEQNHGATAGDPGPGSALPELGSGPQTG